jgi:hypothetical protein
MTPSGDDNIAGDNRRKLLIVAAVVGVLVIVSAAYFLLKSGGSTNSADAGVAIVPHAVSNGAQPKAAAATAAHAPVTLPRQVAAPVGRNPFKPLYVVPVAPSSAAPGAAVVTSTTSGSSSTSSTSSSATTSTVHPVWVRFLAVTGSQSATFDVGFSNGKKLTVIRYVVKAPAGSGGTVFASSFALQAVHPGYVIVTYGDGTPFKLDSSHNETTVS